MKGRREREQEEMVGDLEKLERNERKVQGNILAAR